MSYSKIKIFISYTREDWKHNNWVENLALRLKNEDFEVKFDKWDVKYGDDIPKYMEKSVTDSDFVLIICTPTYKDKADGRSGGAGYEVKIIAADILNNSDSKKYIPIIREGCVNKSLPTWAKSIYAVNAAQKDVRDPFAKLIFQLKNKRQTLVKEPNKEINAKVEESPDSAKVTIALKSLAGYSHKIIINGEVVKNKSEGDIIQFSMPPGKVTVRLVNRYLEYGNRQYRRYGYSHKDFEGNVNLGNNFFEFNTILDSNQPLTFLEKIFGPYKKLVFSKVKP